MKNKTKKIAFASVMAALCVVIMLLGSVITVIDLSCAAAASLIIILCVIELGGYYPWLVWGVVSLISLLLLPDKFGALVFFGFAGYYPMLKSHIEKLSPVAEWAVKLALFNIVLTGIIAASKFILKLPDSEIAFSFVVYGLCNVVFVIFDIALTRLISLYLFKLRSKLKLFK